MENSINENEIVPAPEVPEQPAENKTDFAGVVNNGVEKVKDIVSNSGSYLEKIKKIPSKVWILVASCVVVLIAAIIVLSLLGNTYKTPIKVAEKLLNSKSVDQILDRAPALLNGFGESDANKLLKIIKQSDQFKDVIEDAEASFADAIEDMQDEYGKNYKIKIKIEDKEELENKAVRAFRDQLRTVSKYADQLDDMDSDDYEDAADELGLKKSQVKKMVGILEDFCKDCKSAKVTKGYELSLVVTLTGSELEEPQEVDFTIRVFKVDGRWVPDVFSLISGPLGGLLEDFI